MSGEEPAIQIAPVESPQMVSTIKLPILKKGEYTLWSMRMEQYLTNTDYSLWQVILNGDGPIQVTTDEKGVETKVPLKTTQALLQRQRERIAKSILLLAISDEYQLGFHGIKDAKSLWAAIKKGLDKAYDRFQKLISLLEVHGAAVPNEDANQKFLRALPSSWNNVALIMRNKDGSSGSSSNSQNVAFLSAEDTSSSNEVNTANGVSTASGHNSQGQASSSSYTDDLMFSFFANQSNSPQLDDEDLEQIDHDDLEEMDLKWQVAMLSMRVKRFYKKAGRKLIFNGKEPVGFDKTKVECFNYHRRGHFARECREPRNQGNKNGDAGYRSRDNTKRVVPVETSDALVVQDNALIVQDGLGYEWSYIAQDEPTEFALMAYTSNSSGSDTELGLESVEAHLRYGDQLNENDSSGSELFNSVFDSRSSNGDNNQTNNRFKTDNGYHVVPPPLTVNYMPPLADLSFAGLDDSVYRPTANKTSASVSQVETSTSQTSNTSVEMPRVESVRSSGVIIEDWVIDDEDIFQYNDLQATDKPSLKKIEFTNARNEFIINHQNKFVPSAILTRLGRVLVSAAKQRSPRATASTSTFRPVNIATHTNRVNVLKLRTNAFHKPHSLVRRVFYKSTAPNTRISNKKVNIVSVNGVNTAGKIAVSAVKGNGVTAVKASTGCVWRPKMTNLNMRKDNSGSWVSKRVNYIDPQGRLKHMTGNKDFLTDYQDIDGGFVAFGGSARGELKFNLFSVSQMCDKKNSVLFTETECLVLSPDFKLLDASQVLLRVPRQSNMYSFDLKNVVPSGDLTCLFAKAIIDESKLWHGGWVM
ncbi:ribonuclease H-like domain-containing protein [Tanacetum coccineum]